LVHQPLIGLLYQPPMIDDDDECGAVSGMRIGRGNQSTRSEPAPLLLSLPQVPHDDLGSNPGCHGGKPATNHLSFHTQYIQSTMQLFPLLLLLLVTCFSRKRPSSGVLTMPKLSHCITCIKCSCQHPHTRDNIICRGNEQHTDRSKTITQQRAASCYCLDKWTTPLAEV
jgi:hypothetical protein